MKNKYDPHAETPDEVFLDLMNKRQNTVTTIPKWDNYNYHTKILARFIWFGLGFGLGIGTGIMLENKYTLNIGPSLKVERRDVNQDGIEDLLLSDPEEMRKNIILIGEKNGAYTRMEVYNNRLEEKIKQETK